MTQEQAAKRAKNHGWIRAGCDSRGWWSFILHWYGKLYVIAIGPRGQVQTKWAPSREKE